MTDEWGDDEYVYDAGTSIANSQFLEESGYFHFMVTQVDFPATKRDGSLDDKALFRVHFEVLSPGHEGKLFSAGFKDPNTAGLSESQVDYHARKRDRLFVATNLMQESDLGKAGLKIRFSQMAGEQLVMKTEYGPGQGGGKSFCNISFTDIFHVDDPAVKTVQKNEEMLRKIPAGKRKIGQRPAPAKVQRQSIDDVL